MTLWTQPVHPGLGNSLVVSLTRFRSERAAGSSVTEGMRLTTDGQGYEGGLSAREGSGAAAGLDDDLSAGVDYTGILLYRAIKTTGLYSGRNVIVSLKHST